MEALLDYNRRLNRVFGVCVQVQNTARPLADLAFRMELLARNGVAHAARLDRDMGRSLAVLTSFLSELPEQIGPVIREIEDRCGGLCQTMAECTQSMRVYFALTQTVLEVARRHASVPPMLSHTDADHLERLEDAASGWSLSALEAHGVGQVLARSRAILTEVRGHLAVALRGIHGIRELLDDLGGATRQSRYLSQCIRVEVAQIDDGGHRFDAFADQVSETVDDLEAGLRSLNRTSQSGSSLIEALRQELMT